jgi:soluble P-type ATPase
MIEVSLPGRQTTLQLKNLLLDLNGTLTVDGKLISGVKERVELLKEKLQIYILTAALWKRVRARPTPIPVSSSSCSIHGGS